ncbi:hypothetical protein MAR_003880 [Mya arenaria]|uniref:Uncharacterized protein n=1 Tax=Mya arenaria TaxID=6604 RepID=A0ABY7EUZ4_MYAAR|nr:hypothetical protein MAR_003880 [Mya arenaria]
MTTYTKNRVLKDKTEQQDETGKKMNLLTLLSMKRIRPLEHVHRVRNLGVLITFIRNQRKSFSPVDFNTD